MSEYLDPEDEVTKSLINKSNCQSIKKGEYNIFLVNFILCKGKDELYFNNAKMSLT